jgi:hypothetical protein
LKYTDIAFVLEGLPDVHRELALQVYLDLKFGENAQSFALLEIIFTWNGGWEFFDLYLKAS